MKDLKLTDLVETDIIHEVQDIFVSKHNIETGVHCSDGEYVTTSHEVCDFCEKYVKQTEEGMRRCKECDRNNVKIAEQMGTAHSYTCHAGLIDFTAPIMVNGEVCGYVMGGQICTEPLTREQTDRLASEIGADPEELYAASQRIRQMNQEQIDGAVDNAGRIAKLLSDIADNKYAVLKSSEEIENAAKMKSDFLANMSHEIRTPMNAIMGMADMALRETDMETAKSYIRQIKRSSTMLLSIINDILDFSKIESGKMDISMVEYSPVRMIEDIEHILQARIKDKNVALTLDIDPNLPGELMGDDIRIRQIITNLANNAIKFTSEGEVKVSVYCEDAGPRQKKLLVSVKDTGIGIKKEDLKKIFESFQQVDSKRNRNIEGTGLGLAISKNLIELMNGELHVESEYGKGSEFSFYIPQLELKEVPPVKAENPEEIHPMLFVNNPFTQEQMRKDIQRICGGVVEVASKEELKQQLDTCNFLFIDKENMDDEIHEWLGTATQLNTTILVNVDDETSNKEEHVQLVHRPLFSQTLVQIFNHEELNLASSEDEMVPIDFIAPDAKVLVVDDNETNLAVCAGLLQPLKMQVDTAISGADAIRLISEKMYDLIFMDHMMPEMDGIETTHIIRRMHMEYNNVPIIALTANALETIKGQFLVEGMNDFMPKPIDFKEMLEMLRRWLPQEKLISVDPSDMASVESGADLPNIPGVDSAAAFAKMGSMSVYQELINYYYKNVDKKSDVIQGAFDQQDWPRYTTEVHALKSSSRQLGAMELGELAEQLENAGHENNIVLIQEKTASLLAMYQEIKNNLEPFVQIEETVTGNEKLEEEQIRECLSGIINAIAELDIDLLNDYVSKLSSGIFEDPMKLWVATLQTATEDYDFEQCEGIATQWLAKLDE